MDFDDLDELEGGGGDELASSTPVPDEEFENLVEEVKPAAAIRARWQREGITSCRALWKSIDVADADQLKTEVEKLCASAGITSTKEQVAVRNVWRRCKARVEECHEADLRSAVASNDKNALVTLVADAEKLDITTNFVDQARAKLDELSAAEHAAPLARLQEAVDSANLDALEKAILEVKDIGVAPAKYKVAKDLVDSIKRDIRRKEQAAADAEAEAVLRKMQEEEKRKAREAKAAADAAARALAAATNAEKAAAMEKAAAAAAAAQEAEAEAARAIEEAEALLAAEKKKNADAVAATEAALIAENCVPEWIGGNSEYSYNEYMDWYMGELVQGKVPGPTVRQQIQPGWKVDKDFELRKKQTDSARAGLASQGIKPLSPFIKMTMGDLEQKTSTVHPGEMYGLPVPVNLEDLQGRGAKYLTQCFQTAGTIDADNAVSKVLAFKRLPMTGKDAAGGSGPKAFITVQWLHEREGLHSELFCKMPWDMGKGSAKAGELTPEEQKEFYKQKEKGIDPYYRWKCSATIDYEAQESTIYRFLGPIFPFRIPKYYFADICRQNTNYVLITEKIAYPKKPYRTNAEYQPYEILPVAEKYFDFQLEPTRMRSEMYYCIMRAQARMAAYDKLGYFDVAPPEMRGLGMRPPSPGEFQWPPQLTEKRRAAKCRQGKSLAELWKEFLTDKAKHCYEKQYYEPDFLNALMDTASECNGYKDDIFLYSCLFPHMVALQHTNLQSDNAYYWINADGEMDAGLIDWGGASPGNFCQRMLGSITSAEGHILHEHEEGLLRCFITEYWRECGIKLDYQEVLCQWMLAYCTYILSCGTNIEMEVFRETPREMWKTVKSRWDDKVVGRWNVRCYAFMIGSMLEYLHLRWCKNGKKRLHCHDVFVTWKKHWEARGMT